MNTYRKLQPAKMLVIYSAIITAILGYGVYYAFTQGNGLIQTVVIIAALLVVLPILKMPTSVQEDDDCIRINQVVGHKVFLKKEYVITPIKTKSSFSVRMFATSVYLYWGYFWSKSLGTFYALCVNNSNLIMLTNKDTGNKIVIDAPAGEASRIG